MNIQYINKYNNNYLFNTWNIIIFIILILSIFVIIINIKNDTIYEYEIDNKIFFNPSNFELFNEIQLNWEIIRDEAKYILENSPRLDISRNYNDWKNSLDYMNKIINEYGWIRSWKYEDKDKNTNGNYNWLNYGILYEGLEFNKNILYCPKTFKMLEKIKDKINIAGFSYFKGNALIEKHKDATGIKNNCLAFHLGLIIPEPNSTCQFIINDGNKNFSYTEKPGKITIFDATYEHYAFNKSSKDRIILYIDFKL